MRWPWGGSPSGFARPAKCSGISARHHTAFQALGRADLQLNVAPPNLRMAKNPPADRHTLVAGHCGVGKLLIFERQGTCLHFAMERCTRNALREMTPVISPHRAGIIVRTRRQRVRATLPEPIARLAHQSEAEWSAGLDDHERIGCNRPEPLNKIRAPRSGSFTEQVRRYDQFVRAGFPLP